MRGVCHKRSYMKKIIAIALLVTLAMTSVSARSRSRSKNADTILHSLNFSVPFSSKTLTLEDDWGDIEVDADFTGFGINYNLMSVSKNGLSFIGGAGIGYAGMNTTWKDAALDYSSDAGGAYLGGKFGVGYAPLNTDKIVLGFHGFIGINTSLVVGDGEYTYTEYGYAHSKNETCTITNVCCPLGIDAMFAYKLSKTFGLTAGLDLSLNLVDKGKYGLHKHDDSFSANGSGNVELRFGICWIR